MSIWVLEDEAHAEPILECSTLEQAETELKTRLLLPESHQLNVGPCSTEDCTRKYQIIEYDNSRVPWQLVTASEVFVPN